MLREQRQCQNCIIVALDKFHTQTRLNCIYTQSIIERLGCLIDLNFTNFMRHMYYSLKSNPAVRYERRAAAHGKLKHSYIIISDMSSVIGGLLNSTTNLLSIT